MDANSINVGKEVSEKGSATAKCELNIVLYNIYLRFQHEKTRKVKKIYKIINQSFIVTCDTVLFRARETASQRLNVCKILKLHLLWNHI